MATQVNGLSAPLVYKRNLSSGNIHPLDGIPLEIAAQVDSAGDYSIAHYFDHFTGYTGPLVEGSAGPWTLVGTTGTATITIQAEDYGKILLTTSSVEDDNAMLRQRSMIVNYSTSESIWIAANFNVADADQTEVFFGISESNDDFMAALPTYGIFFEKAEGALNYDFHVRSGGVSTENTADFSGLLLGDQLITTLAVRIENGNVTPYVHTPSVGWITGTTILSSDANMPASTDDMFLHFGIESGEAAIQRMEIDWALIAKEQ